MARGPDLARAWSEVFVPLLSGPERPPEIENQADYDRLTSFILDGLKTCLGDDLNAALDAAGRVYASAEPESNL